MPSSPGRATQERCCSPSRTASNKTWVSRFGSCRKASGLAISDYRPLQSIGSGVFELRDQDERGWYRVVYLSRIDDVIHVLHCFEKKSREMPRRDFETARRRLKLVKARLAEEKRSEKRR